MMAMTSQKGYALDWIDEHAEAIFHFHLRIWK